MFRLAQAPIRWQPARYRKHPSLFPRASLEGISDDRNFHDTPLAFQVLRYSSRNCGRDRIGLRRHASQVPCLLPDSVKTLWLLESNFRKRRPRVILIVSLLGLSALLWFPFSYICPSRSSSCRPCHIPAAFRARVSVSLSSEPTALPEPHTNTIFAHQIPAHPLSPHQLTPHTPAIRIITR